MKNTWIVGLMVVVLACFGFGCEGEDNGADAEVAKQTADMMKEANAQAGMPAIVNFQEKKLAKLIYELRDNTNLVCYAYYYNAMEGKRGDFIGKCIGFGLPYCVQYSNPERVVDLQEQHHTNWTGHGTLAKIPQPEPNGLFMPQTLSATWLMLVNPKTGEPQPAYFEPVIIVSPFALHDE